MVFGEVPCSRARSSDWTLEGPGEPHHPLCPVPWGCEGAAQAESWQAG